MCTISIDPYKQYKTCEKKMTPNYPQRIESHQLEEISKRFFNQCLPRNWTSEIPDHDYGIDLKVDIYDEQNSTGMELLIQLKASTSATPQEYETIILKRSTYNYLWDKLQVVMLVKYVEEENKAYWQLLSNIPEPDQEQESFTIRIPKKNDLSSINWRRIHDYVKMITIKKLYVRQRNVFENNDV